MKSIFSSHRSGAKAQGFTLIELLVVITIIAILAAMVFPVANGVLRKTRSTQAKNDAMQVRQAIETYFTEYRKYPVKNSTGGSDEVMETNNVLMDVLMGSEREVDGLNPRRISFFGGKKAKGNPPKGGVQSDGAGGGELFDPWGEYFIVTIDTNRNDRVADPDEGGQETIPNGVIVYSYGPDRQDDRGQGDDVTTW